MMHLLKKYLGKIYVSIGWTFLIILLLSLPGSVLPNETHFAIPQFDKLVHISLFGGFVLLWNFYLSGRPLSTHALLKWFFLIFMLGNGLGIGMEFVQKYWIPNRDFDTEDIIADMIGAGIAYGFSNIYLIKNV
ncbi:MAG TPA: VanZ family protein [Puia sp.]|nr:VanZ family protein [Puia sp.]